MGSRVYDNDTTITTTTDNRVGVADTAILVQGDGSATRVEAGATNVQGGSSLTINNTTTDQGALAQAALISNTALNAVGAAFGTMTRAASDAADRAITAQRQTSDNAISGIRGIADDALALARSNNADAYRFAADTQTGFLGAVQSLNDTVGLISAQDRDFASGLVTGQQTFATGLVDQVLLRSQSADQQNFEATLDFLKSIGVAAAVVVAIVFVVPKFAKA